MSQRARLLPLTVALAAAILVSSTPAAALIVWDGQIVHEWPDQPVGRVRNAAAPGALQAVSRPIGIYPDPKGSIWGLTILVDFSDAAPAFTKEQVNAWLNQKGYSDGGLNGSVRDYYLDNSNGMVDFQNQVVGFYRASQPKSYYEADTGYTRARALVNEAIAALDGQIDFSMFDNDGDGRTEAISLVYAGPQQQFGRGLWPHAGGLSGTRDGVQLTRYQITGMGTRLGLYVFAHETGHMLFGWPDLYGFGNYCIMGSGSSSTNPVGINDFYRADQGWIPVVDIDSATNARFYAAPNTAGYRYVNPARTDEAFFWSNVQNTNRWSTLRGAGMVVLHFDYAIRRNDPPNPLGLAVVQADGLRQLDQTQWPMPGSEPADFFHAGTRAEFSGTTTPASRWNDGSASGLRIHEISANGARMTFAVGSGTPVGGIGGGTSLGGAGSGGGLSGAGTGAGGAPGGAAGTSALGGRGAMGGAAGAATAGGPQAGSGGTSASAGNSASGGIFAAGGSSPSGGTLAAGGGSLAAGGTFAIGGSLAAGGTLNVGGDAGSSRGGASGTPVMGGIGGSSSNVAGGVSAGAAAVGAAAAAGPTIEGASCGCRLADTPPRSAPWALALVASFLLASRRRQRPTRRQSRWQSRARGKLRDHADAHRGLPSRRAR